MQPQGPRSVTSDPGSDLLRRIQQSIAAAGGWIGFDAFMAMALYEPGLGYYANQRSKFGLMPQSGSDFVTAPELSPLFGQTLAGAVAEALRVSGTAEVWEFGAGSGALAEQLLGALDAAGHAVRYTIVDVSGSLRERQQHRLAAWGDRVRWVDALPDQFSGVVVGNEVLDAMPVQLIAREAHAGDTWVERGVAWHEGRPHWADVPTDRRPPIEVPGEHAYLTEVHPQAQAFMRTLGERLASGVALFIDYGFPEREYYHPQRHMGTLMCHQGHQAGGDPLLDVGQKDITAHVDFTGIVVAAQDVGFDLRGYTSQARFLINCGLLQKMEQTNEDRRGHALKLIMEHEMGELFKVVALSKGLDPRHDTWLPLGFASGDRSHTL